MSTNEINLLDRSLLTETTVFLSGYTKTKNFNIKGDSLNVYSYDYGGYQYGEYNNNLGDGRCGNFFYKDTLINLKGIGPTKYCKDYLGGYISLEEINAEINNNLLLKELDIKTVKIEDIWRSDTVNKPILVRSNKTWIRLGLLHKLVNNYDKKKIESIRKVLINLFAKEELIECYKEIIERCIVTTQKLERNKICHGSFSSDNILIDGSIIDLGKLKQGVDTEEEVFIEGREFYCMSNQILLMRIYLEKLGGIFDLSEEESIKFVERNLVDA